jgi:hypothetical protein
MSTSGLSKLADILMYSLLLTAVFSILIMIGGGILFKKANRNKTSALYPFINMFVTLEISKASIFWGTLFFVPIINIFVACFMFYKIGTAFDAGFGFKIGLVLLPIVFFPMLALSDKQYKYSEKESFRLLDTGRGESVNLTTKSETNALNTPSMEDDMPQVDSIFKSEIEDKKATEPYKAVKIDVLGLNKLEHFNKNNDSQSDDN